MASVAWTEAGCSQHSEGVTGPDYTPTGPVHDACTVHSLQIHALDRQTRMSEHLTVLWLQLSQCWTQAPLHNLALGRHSLHSCAQYCRLASDGCTNSLLQLPLMLVAVVVVGDPPRCSQPATHPSLQVTVCHCRARLLSCDKPVLLIFSPAARPH